MLGVTTAFEPPWLADVAKWAVVAIAPLILLFAANATMLGLSRHVYVLGTNRQIPSWLAKLGKRRSTPHVAIVIAALMAIGLVLPGDVELLAGVFAFGAMLAISIAHLSLIRLRFTDPDRDRPYRVPFGVRFRGDRGAAAGDPRAAALLGRARRDRAPARRRPLGRRRLDGLRAGRLRDLPPGGRGDLAHRPRGGARAGAAEARARRRARERPRPRLRRGPRRRDRLDGGAARRQRSRSPGRAGHGSSCST